MTFEGKEILLYLAGKGYSSQKVVDTLKCDHSAVAKTIKCTRAKSCSTYLGRVENAYQHPSLLRNHMYNKNQTAEKLRKKRRVDACPNTTLKELDKKYTQPLKGLNCLPKTFNQQRLEFCMMYEGRMVKDWKMVAFSYETDIQAEPNGGHKKVWRKQHEMLSEFALNTSRMFFTSILIWGCIHARGIGDFHVVEAMF